MDQVSLNTVTAAGNNRGEWRARVNLTQHTAILRALTGQALPADQLADYVCSGDAAHLEATTRDTLAKVVKAAKEGLNESQAKRIWPRKVAAVYLYDRAA